MNFSKYNILDTKEKVLALDNYLMDGRFERIAVDTETGGLRFWKDPVIGISLSVNSSDGFYIPFLTWEPDLSSKKIRKIKKVPTEVYEQGHFRCVWTGKTYPENVTNKEYEYPAFIVEILRKHLLDARPQLLMHNAPFDVLMIEYSLGINLQDLVFCDTVLLKHVLDENTSNGLKETGILWSKELGYAVQEDANREQKEMGASVIRNGGKYNKRTKHIWRGDLEPVGKYAIKDTALTFGLFEVGIEKLFTEYEPRHLDWFFEDEVMPLCREVLIPMRRHGVRVDVPYFEEMELETQAKMQELEDTIIQGMGTALDDFSVGASIDETATKKAVVEQLILEEGLEYPTQTNKKGEVKKTLGKPAVKKAFAETGHWLWGWLLGEAELPLTEAEMEALKRRIYVAKTGKRYRFNIGSDAHLRWLFCKQLGYDPKSLPQTDSATKDKIIPSMKATVLKEFFAKKHDFVKPLLLWKKLQKLHKAYIKPIVALNNNGYLHLDFVQSGTISGRFACRGGFNLQTLPRVEELKRCWKCESKDVIVVNPIKLVAVMACNACGHVEEDIICPSAVKLGFIAPEGKVIVNADYSSLEPRCFSFMSGDPKLKAVYLQELDLYSAIYVDMMDREGKYSADPKAPNFLKKLAVEKRNMVKPVVLGVPYGARGPQVAKLMDFKKTVTRRGETKEVLDVERGKEFRELYLNTYPELRKFMDESIALACSQGYVETLVGRRRHFKYTVPVYRILTKAGLSIEEFLEIRRKDLDHQTVDDEHFTYQALKRLGEECGFALYDEKKKFPRTWSFVRAMFKNELNNAVNVRIQGLAAHITNMAMLVLNRNLADAGIEERARLNVHDEVSLYAAVADQDLTAAILKHSMETNKYAMLVDIPMIAEPIIAMNLKEAK